MSKVKLQVAKAVQAYKRGIDKRNVNHTESEIASFIDEQIELKEAEIKTLKKEQDKYGEQNERDFVEGLAVFEEDKIKTVKGREAYAEEYVLRGINKMNNNKDFVVEKKNQILLLKEDIEDLAAFRKVLETLTIEVESED